MRSAVAVAIAVCATLLAGGCASVPGDTGRGDDAGGAPRDGSATVVPAVVPSEGRRWLERGVVLFEQGRFAESLRLLQESPEIAADGVEVRSQSLKVQAFVQCVTGRRAACRRTFDALLALDPAFALAPAEAGHPSWGPEFERAKAAAATVPGARRAAR